MPNSAQSGSLTRAYSRSLFPAPRNITWAWIESIAVGVDCRLTGFRRRSVVDAFDREDWEAALKPLDPDFEFDFTRAIGPMRGVFRLDQVRAFLDEFFGLWEAVRFEVDKLVEAGEQVAVSFINYHRGRDGIGVTVRPSGVFTFRDGRILHYCFYQEWQEALEAVRLSEQDAQTDVS